VVVVAMVVVVVMMAGPAVVHAVPGEQFEDFVREHNEGKDEKTSFVSAELGCGTHVRVSKARAAAACEATGEAVLEAAQDARGEVAGLDVVASPNCGSAHGLTLDDD